MANTISKTTAAANIPQKWANEALIALTNKVVLPGIVSRTWDNDPKQKGDRVNILNSLTINANAKAVQTEITLQTPTFSNVTVILDKHFESSIATEDVAKTLMIDAKMRAFTDAAMKALANQVDLDLIAEAANFTGSAVGAVTGVEVYVEIVEDSTQRDNMETFLTDREGEDIFTIGIIGEMVGTTLPGATSATITLAEGANCKRLVYVAGDVTLKDSAVKAPVAAAMVASVFADLKGKQRVKNQAALSFNDYPLTNIVDYTAYTKADKTALTNGHVTVLHNKTIQGISSFRIYQMVTTYKQDSLGNPSTIYANISDINVEDLMRELVAQDFDAWSAALTMAGDPLTTVSDDLAKMKAHVDALISTFSFIDRDFTNRVEVTSPSANAVQIKIIYKAVDVAHQIELVLVKNIRA